jgi:hypothetical protein
MTIFYWLGDIFTESGCRALPALSCREAVELMKRLGIEPDLIVLNPQPFRSCPHATTRHE